MNYRMKETNLVHNVALKVFKVIWNDEMIRQVKNHIWIKPNKISNEHNEN